MIDLIFDKPAPFARATMEFICVIFFHIFGLGFETWCVFYYGHPDDDKYNYGLVSKLLVIFGMHIVLSFLITMVCDFGLMEFHTGFTSNFDIGKYWSMTYVMKELTCYLFLTYAQYFLDADNDKGIFKPWSKALVWTLLKGLVNLMCYFIAYGFFAAQTQSSVDCLPMTDGDKGEFIPRFGEPACIPECEVYWELDPSICLQYGIVERGLDYGLLDGFLAINQCIGIFMFSIFYSIGLVWLPYRQFIKLQRARSSAIESDTDLKVAKAEIAELSRAMVIIGDALRKRRAAFTKMKSSCCSPTYWWTRFRLNLDTNRYMNGCYILFDQADLVEVRKSKGQSVFTAPVAWIKFISVIILCLFLILYAFIYRIGDSFTSSTIHSTYNSPLNGFMVAVADLQIFPITAAVYFIILFSMISICISGFRGVWKVFPLASPFRSTTRARVKMREMTKLCIFTLFVSSGFPYLQAVHFISVSNGTWVTRNIFSVMQYHLPNLSSTASPEWTGVAFSIAFLCCCFISPPLKYPFDLADEPVNKANQISDDWLSGKSGTSKFSSKIAAADGKISGKANAAKSGLIMKAGQAQVTRVV